MCDEASDNVGDPVPDETVLYRACSKRNFLNESANAVRETAFQKIGERHKDGLSLAISAADSVRHLKRNFGVIRITAQAIRSIDRGLDVRFDRTDPSHVLLRNLPCMDRAEEREQAEMVAAELAIRAEVESSTAFPKQPARINE
jgi:hypothetical protein